MTDRPLPTPTDAVERRVVRDVQAEGWHVVLVPEDDDTPGWGFTVGLFHTYGHPEVIVFGAPLEDIRDLLNAVGEGVRAGERYTADQITGDFLEEADCVFKACDPRWQAPFAGVAVWFYQGEAFPMLQLFWPDDGPAEFPWEAAASPELLASQPSLYADSVDGARVAALLATLD